MQTMPATDKNIIANIKNVLSGTLPEGGHAILYGSRARGDAHSGSDWDVLVLVDKEELSFSDYNAITYPLVMYGWECGEEINPIMYTKKQWDKSVNTLFRENVEHDGIALI